MDTFYIVWVSAGFLISRSSIVTPTKTTNFFVTVEACSYLITHKSNFKTQGKWNTHQINPVSNFRYFRKLSGFLLTLKYSNQIRFSFFRLKLTLKNSPSLEESPQTLRLTLTPPPPPPPLHPSYFPKLKQHWCVFLSSCVARSLADSHFSGFHSLRTPVWDLNLWMVYVPRKTPQNISKFQSILPATSRLHSWSPLGSRSPLFLTPKALLYEYSTENNNVNVLCALKDNLKLNIGK